MFQNKSCRFIIVVVVVVNVYVTEFCLAFSPESRAQVDLVIQKELRLFSLYISPF